MTPPTKAERDALRAIIDQRGDDDSPTHRCKVCGALWRLCEPGRPAKDWSWSLRSPSCGKCCDNVAMDVERIDLGLLDALDAAEEERDRLLWLLRTNPNAIASDLLDIALRGPTGGGDGGAGHG